MHCNSILGLSCALILIAFGSACSRTSEVQKQKEEDPEVNVEGKWNAETQITAMGRGNVPATIRLDIGEAGAESVAGEMNLLIRISQVAEMAEDASRRFDLQGSYNPPHLNLKAFSNAEQPVFNFEGKLNASGDTLKMKLTSLNENESAESEQTEALTFVRQPK